MNKDWLFKQPTLQFHPSSGTPQKFDLGIKHRGAFNGSLNLK
jgi:hypothetical protein